MGDCGGKDIFEQIRRMLRNTVEYYRGYPACFELYADIWSGSMNERAAKVNLDQKKIIDNFWINLAEAGVAQGEIDTRITLAGFELNLLRLMRIRKVVPSVCTFRPLC